MTKPRRNMVRDAVLRDDQAEQIEQLAGGERSMSEVIRTLVDVGLFILTGELRA